MTEVLGTTTMPSRLAASSDLLFEYDLKCYVRTAFIVYTDTSSTLVYGKHVKCIVYIGTLKNMPYSSALLYIILNCYKSLFDLWFNAVDALPTRCRQVTTSPVEFETSCHADGEACSA